MKSAYIKLNKRSSENVYKGEKQLPEKLSIIRTALVAAILLIQFVVAGKASAQDIFAPLTNLSGVESTYVSGRFSHNKKTWRSTDGRHGLDLSRGFSSLYTYQCYSTDAVDKASKLLKDYLQKHPEMEVVMRTKQAGGEYVIYESFSEDNKVTKMIVWSSDAPNVCEIVVIDWKDGITQNTSDLYEDGTLSKQLNMYRMFLSD